MTGITPVTPVVEMVIGGVWTDITDDVRLDSAHSGGGIQITRGVPNEGNQAEPTEVTFTLNNSEGKYSPKNELSPNYGQIKRNTPIRVALSRREDDFGHNETDTWGRMPSWLRSDGQTILGDKWTLTGAASRFDISGGTATIVSGSGTSAATFGVYADCEIVTRVKTSVRDSEFGIILRMKDPLVDSQDFENGIGDWVTTGGTSTLGVTTATFHSGTQAGILTVGGSPTVTTAKAGSRKIEAGRSYRLRIWMRCSIATTLNALINWQSVAGGSTIGTASTSTAVSANTWTLFEVTGTAPDLAEYAIFGGTIGGSPANGTIVLLDDAELLENDNFDMYTAYITPGTPDLLRLGGLTRGGGSFVVNQNQGVNINTNEWWWMKAQCTGIRRRVKWWKDGDPEPSGWNWRNYDVAAATGHQLPPRSGQVGLFAKDGTSTVTFDSIQVNVWRAYAEITKLPPRWDLSRQDQWVPIVAQGLLRRVGQGRKALESAVTLYFRSYTTSKLWVPLESFESNIGTVGNMINGGPTPRSLSLTNSTPDASGTFSLPGVDGYADFTEDTSYLRVYASAGATPGIWSYMNFIRVPNAPASDILLYRVYATGTARIWYVYLQTDRAVRVEARTLDGVLLGSDVRPMYNGTADLPYGCWLAANLYVYDSGGTVTWAWNYHYHASTAFASASGTFSGSAGVFTGADYYSSSAHTAAGNMQVTQIFHYAGDLPFVTDAFARAAAAYNGEECITRWQRLAANAGIKNTTTGFSGDSKPMGTQIPSKTLDLMGEAIEVDDSIQLEERDDSGLNFRSRESLWNQIPIDLDVDAGHLTSPLEPVDDDQQTRNDVTIKRRNGGSSRSIQTSGPLNVNDPEDDPDGVGTYDTAPEVNLYTDDQTLAAADWGRSKGTIDEMRYPSMKADLNAEAYDLDPHLTAQLLAIDSGDMLRIRNPEVQYEKSWQLVQSYVESFDQYDYDLTFVTKPGVIYNVGVVGVTTRLATRYQTLTASKTSGIDTRIQSTTTSPGALWDQVKDDPAGFPFDIMIQGARLRVHAVGDVLNSNPYMTDGIQDWTSLNSATLYWERRLSFTRILDEPCLRATSTLTGSSGFSATQATQVAVTPGETIRVSGWLKTDAAIGVQIRASYYLSNGTSFLSDGAPGFVTPGANVWYHFSADLVVPATAAFARISPAANIGSAGQILWATHVRLMKPGSYATSPQTLSIEQTPVNGVAKVLDTGAAITVADPWRVAY